MGRAVSANGPDPGGAGVAPPSPVPPSPVPWWWRAAPPEPGPARPLDAVCDVAIVGAGFTGLAAALPLASTGRTVQVFDREAPGAGASTRNGGIVSGNLRVSLGAAIRRFGEARAVAMVREGREARQDLRDFIARAGIACDFTVSGRFTGALRPADLAWMAREAALLRRHAGIEAAIVGPADTASEIGTNLYCGGMLRPDIGLYHPAKFHAGLRAAVAAAGGIVHGHTPVGRVRREADGFVLLTPRGTVKARQLVMATNAATDGVDPWLRRRLVPVASRMVVTAPLRPDLMAQLLPHGRAMGEMRYLYRYFRPSPDGRRLMLGARDPGGSPVRAAAAVRRELVRLFPALAAVPITHSWTGHVAMHRDNLPRLFCHDGIHYAAGYCGSGTVWAWWLGKQVARRIVSGQPSGSAFEAPPPAAVPGYRGRPWFMPLVTGWYRTRELVKYRGIV